MAGWLIIVRATTASSATQPSAAVAATMTLTMDHHAPLSCIRLMASPLSDTGAPCANGACRLGRLRLATSHSEGIDNRGCGAGGDSSILVLNTFPVPS